MNIGARVIKTGIAVLLSSFIVQYFFNAPIFVAALAATIAIKPSLVHAFKYLKEIIVGNLVGATIALSLYYLFGISPIVIALAVILCISVSVSLGYKNSVNLTILTSLVILGGSFDGSGDITLLAAIQRLLQLLIGVLSAFVVNITLIPPKNEERFFNEVKVLTGELTILLKVATSKSKSFNSYKKEVKRLNKKFDHIKKTLSFLEDDLKKPYLKNKYNFIKKVILYKQHIKILEKELSLFKSLETRFSNLENHSDEQLLILKSYLDELFLEQNLCLLAQDNRVRDNRYFDQSSHEESLELNLKLNVRTLLDDFDNQNEDFWWRVFPIITSCVDLKSDIIKLKKIQSKINF